MEFMPQLTILGFVVLAGLLGGLVGIEREMSHKSAGLRTHMFVAASAAVLIFLGQYVIEYYVAGAPNLNFRSDPIRVVQAIIVGISFIGAGVIIKDVGHTMIRNLTTATSILFTAAIGIAVGLQLIWLAIGMTILIVLSNVILIKFEKNVHPKDYHDE